MIVDAPLHGEWVALHTPADRVPSHGTHYLAQTYAFDFVQHDPRSNLPYERGLLRHLLYYQRADSFLCWNRPVYSVFDGRVASIGEGWPDRLRINLFKELVMAGVWQPQVKGDDIRPLAGNYVIVQGVSAVAFYAHLRLNSVAVMPNQTVRAGDVIGHVGNSGNSTMPHLHFHLMDQPEIFTASGVPCFFRKYERCNDGAWVPVQDGIPGKFERIRFPATRDGMG